MKISGPSDHFLDGYDLEFEYEVEVREGGGRIVSLRAIKQYHEGDPPLLEVSTKRLTSREPARGEPIDP